MCTQLRVLPASPAPRAPVMAEPGPSCNSAMRQPVPSSAAQRRVPASADFSSAPIVGCVAPTLREPGWKQATGSTVRHEVSPLTLEVAPGI